MQGFKIDINIMSTILNEEKFLAALVITNRDVMSHVSYHVSRRCDNYDDGMVFGMGYKYAAHH